MKFFVDTADVAAIKELNDLGMVDGVTTNPSLILKSGRDILEVTKEICDIVSGPVSAEVVALTADEMIAEGRKLAEIAPNITVKVPLTWDGLKTCKVLSDEGKMVNVTLCFSVNQALLAAKAGATFISPFVGRLDDINLDGMELISDIRQVYDNYGFDTQILAASIRTANHVTQCALIGADVMTAPPAVIKAMAFQEPVLLHRLLSHLADSIASYVRYQIDCGAQVVQLFDSWAGQLSPIDYDSFAAPYQKRVIDQVKATHPDTPLILYISGSAGVLERMGRTGVDIVSLDWTVDMAEGRDRIAQSRAQHDLAGRGGVQGNFDPAILYADHSVIKERTEEILKKAGPIGHVMNLGHGIEATTPEENAPCFVETVRNFRHE